MWRPECKRPQVVLRGGGLGDFILILPWLRVLRAERGPVTLIVRRAHARLVAADDLHDAWLDLDGGEVSTLFAALATPVTDAANAVEVVPTLDARLAAHLAGADVYHFLPDDDAALATTLRAADVRSVTALASRPTTPPHLTSRLFAKSGLAEPPDLFATSALVPGNALADAAPTSRRSLWLHPGSGSAAKNLPPSWYRAEAERWLANGRADRVILSYGEADDALHAPMRVAFRDLIDAGRVTVHRDLELPALRAAMRLHAVAYVGGDTGVTHLAAALGLPVVAVFRATDPAIWRPLGCSVEVRIEPPGGSPGRVQ